jgi:hypothetical protein
MFVIFFIEIYFKLFISIVVSSSPLFGLIQRGKDQGFIRLTLKSGACRLKSMNSLLLEAQTT